MSGTGPARALSRAVPGISPLVKITPARDRAFLAYIRAQPCALCMAEGCTEPHHVLLPGEGARGRKPSDYLCVPLCGPGARDCHGQAQAYKLNTAQQLDMMIAGWKLLAWWLDAKAEGLAL